MDKAYFRYRVAGRPTLVPTAFLFLDVLGTGAERGDEEAQAYLVRTHEAFVRARSWGESAQGEHDLTVAAWFSDNLALGIPVPPGDGLTPGHAVDLLAMYSALHQLSLSVDGLFARGAITFGLLYADANFVHGPALNRAYRLESKQVKYPRVVLDDSAVRALTEAAVTANEEGAGSFDELDVRLAVGEDGRPFVDYLRYIEYVTPEAEDEPAAFADMRDRIRYELEASEPDEYIHAKYEWLATYFDERVRSIDWRLQVSHRSQRGGPFRPFMVPLT